MNAAPTTKRGYPLPGGVTLLKDGINFSIFARHASRVSLVVDPESDDGRGKKNPQRIELELDEDHNRTGDMWHILVCANYEDFCYGFRIDGPDRQDETGLVYDFSRILIDPYSRSLLPRQWGEAAQYGEKPCCRVVSGEFDWQNDRHPKTPLADTVIYELHVRGFTRDSSSGVASPGTYLGLIEKIPYLKDLGITAVELLPVTEFDENDNIFRDPVSNLPLKNFWGYSPVSFFAVNSGYASAQERAVEEFKTMVRALHKAGIEVFLDMVYNHSGEGGYDGTTSSFRGIDNPIYYLLDQQKNYYNFSGCGNTMNCNHPVVRDLIRESLRYWVTEMHVDGFRFDLASILGRDQQGKVLSNPPMIEIIGQDPVLRDTKMIAEAWDAAGLYQVGSFSRDTRWAEWNGRFRDDIRAFMAGHDGAITHLATRIAGSSDLYQVNGRSPLCSINFITSHDGFTLHDLVSYNDKHNRANGEDNRDGDNHNLSWNSGHEGLTDSSSIQALRVRRMKSFTVLLLLSQGIPMICAGDEFARTQQGNNNAWCQDNQTSWLDWTLLKTNSGFHRFFRSCIALRKKHSIFRREEFFLPFDSKAAASGDDTIDWQYLKPGEQNWAADCRGLAFQLRPAADSAQSSFFVMLNGNKKNSLSFTLPQPGENQRWVKIIDTAASSPDDFITTAEASRVLPLASRLTVRPFGCIVLQSSMAISQSGGKARPTMFVTR
jgi:isoamylase